MDQQIIFLTILGMALVTYVPRFLPTWLLSSRSLPPLATTWLRYVPVAVLAAMLLPSLIVQETRVSLIPRYLFLYAALPTILVAWKTKSLLGAVTVGVGIVAVARLVFGQ